MTETLLVLVAVGLDLLLGDPPGWPHPVRFLGRLYDGLERLAAVRGWRNRLFGTVGVLAVAVGAGGLVGLACRLPLLGPVFWLYFAFAGLALGDLLRQARLAARFLEYKDLEAARRVVAGLVSRETGDLDAAGLSRALAESVSENANDGFVAPLFFLMLGGPGLLWAYKAVSTADSMWGYRTPRHARLGWFGARADDALAFAPARLTAGAMWLVAGLFGPRPAGLWGKIARDAGKSASPNAGWPMAAAAWVCGAGMGGPARYFGRLVEKPRLGPTDSAWDAKRQQFLRRLVLLSGFIIVVLMVLIRSLL